MTKELLKKYADLIVHVGANVQPGQVVNVYAAVQDHEIACLIMEAAYKVGAKKVNIEWSCDKETRLNFIHADTEVLAGTLPWEKAKLQQMVDDLPCRIYIESEDPDILAGIDTEKISYVMQKKAAVRKPYRDAIDGKHQWLIVAVPSEPWARKCFPELSAEEAVEKLWQAILTTVRITETNDPVAEWKAHSDFTVEKATWLNNQAFKAMRYSAANGTDFVCELIPGAHWEAAGAYNNENGAFYIPNMPTEEVFTSPMAGKCEGTLVASMPLSWNGQLIENFSVTFEGGKAVSCKAEKGQELLEKMLKMDETSCMLGELALVPKESPVKACGFLFYNTLFDENAACHVALGDGFKEVLPDGGDLTTEQAKERGINNSIIHVDFMIGTEDLSVRGIKEDGTEVDVFVNGTWA